MSLRYSIPKNSVLLSAGGSFEIWGAHDVGLLKKKVLLLHLTKYEGAFALPAPTVPPALYLCSAVLLYHKLFVSIEKVVL